MTSPSRRKHLITVPATPPAARPCSLAAGNVLLSLGEGERRISPSEMSAFIGPSKPAWRAWLEAAAVAAACLAGAPALFAADDAPPARFLAASDAQPLSAPASPARFGTPTIART